MSTAAKDVLTTDLRARLKELSAKELENLLAYFEGLEPKAKLDYFLNLMPFVLPKVSSVEHDLDDPVSWNM